MSKTMCPGQDTMFWRASDVFEIPCAVCGAEVEFFKDDAKRRCRACGNLIRNPRLNLGCAQWCEHAKECLGYDPKEREAQAKGGEDALVDRLIHEIKKVFGPDQKRISHALAVLEHAERIMAAEGGDPRVVLAAAVLHDIGIPQAEKKHGSSTGRWQEAEGPPIARAIMEGMDMDPDTVDHVARIIANHHSARDIDTLEFRILWDADWLVNLPHEYEDQGTEKMEERIERIFKTETGKLLARQLFL